jgi:serine/threonine-protein kinase
MSSDDATKTQALQNAPSAPTQRDLSNSDKLDAGTMVGEYVIQDILGTGGFAQVYRAEHRILGRKAAVKVLSREMAASAEMVQRFIREAVVVNRIRHPNIVDIYDFGRLGDGRPYFIMELLSGRSLGAILEARGRCSPAEALSYLEPVCSALQAAHEAGVVHRDLKASNIMVCGDEQNAQIKLLDFGIAKLLRPEPGEAGLTTEERRLGTSHAMAPEQIRGATIDGRTDVYALGALLFRLLTAQHPFWAKNPLEIERLHLQAPPPRPSQIAPVSPAVEAVVLRCLEKDASRRYPSARAFIEALGEAVGGPAKRSDEAARSTAAAAIYAEVKLDASAQEDEVALGELAMVLDTIEQELTGAGFALLLQTGSSILGVRPIPEAPAEALQTRQELLKVAKALYQSLDTADRDPRLQVSICAHVGQAEARNTAEGVKMTGGAIARLDDWVVRGSQGWHATPQAMEGLSTAHV